MLLVACHSFQIGHAALVLHSHTADDASKSVWRPLPHVDRRHVLRGAAVIAGTQTVARSNPAMGEPTPALFTVTTSTSSPQRSVASIDSHLAIPVWPSWGGGRVVPISLGGALEEPFLLLAHHKHWFDPRDPLREPFKKVGKALQLPYVDVEGFPMHPHRGFDIWTYVLDGSDGFCHRDSLSNNKEASVIYRGGCAQWMRTGSGVMHEEFWETKPNRRTSIELFQLWVNLPAKQKFDPPVVEYVGTATEHPWMETRLDNGVHTRHLTDTLDASLFGEASMAATTSTSTSTDNDNKNRPDSKVRQRPRIEIQHVKIPPGTTWEATALSSHSALVYVREGTATLPEQDQKIKSLQSASFQSDGDKVVFRNMERTKSLDLLFFTGQPLRESIAMGGPIVMNNQQEIMDAYRQLQAGTFLDRDVALRTQKQTARILGYG